MTKYTGDELYCRGLWRALVRYSLVQSKYLCTLVWYRQRYVYCGKQRNEYPFPGFYPALTLSNDHQKCDCSRLKLMCERLDNSALDKNFAIVSPTFNLTSYPLSNLNVIHVINMPGLPRFLYCKWQQLCWGLGTRLQYVAGVMMYSTAGQALIVGMQSVCWTLYVTQYVYAK